jgi:cytochrome c peroxidase
MKQVFVLLFTMLVVLVSGCNQEPKITQADKDLLSEAQDVLEVLPKSLIDEVKNKDMIALGKRLYLEAKLSKSGTISCNSCHGLTTFGVDNEKGSPGHDGTRGDRNAPTSFNAALHIAQFWDGRAATVEDQALGPLLNPIEHGLKDEAEAMQVLKDAGYEPTFKQVFGDNGFTFKNIGTAIGAFEKTLLTPSRFDDYLAGDIKALSVKERKGLKKFVEIGCTTCHNGAAIGGGMYQRLGVEEPYPTEDLGRYNVTKDEDDKHVFKVPSLRNVTKTAPYFHDGSLKTLDEVIPIMAKHQLGVKVSQEDVDDIKAFLVSLEAKNPPKM